MPRIMSYYKKVDSLNSKHIAEKNKKSSSLYEKIRKEDGFVRIPATCSLYSDNAFLPLNPFIEINKKTKKDTLICNKPIIKDKIKTACSPLKITKAIQEVSIITGALSFGINALCFFGIIAARERGYFGGMGGEIFLILGSVYIMFRILKYAQSKDCSKQ